MKKSSLILIMVFYTLLVQATENSRILPIGRQENTPFIELNTGYYYTNSNYSSYFTPIPLSGAPTNTPAFMYYVSQDLSIGYTMRHWIELELFLTGFLFAQSHNTQTNSLSVITNGINTLKRFGIAIRSHQKWGKDSGGFVPELSFSAPFYKINYNSLVPILDDDSLHFTPALWFYLKSLNILYPYIQIGARLRPQPISSLVIWKAGIMLRWNIFELGIHNYGLWTMFKEKSYSTLLERNQLLSQANAGSLKFFSRNPSVTGFTGWLGLNLYNLSLRLSGDIDVAGQSYAEGYSIMLSVILQIEPKRKIERLFNDKREFKIQTLESPSTTINEDPLLEETPEETPLTDEEEEIKKEIPIIEEDYSR